MFPSFLKNAGAAKALLKIWKNMLALEHVFAYNTNRGEHK